MAFAHSPKIVTDGLVFLLDAANPKSYNSGSAFWKDIVTGVTGSFENGTSYDSANLGSIVTDGTDDHVEFTSYDSDTQLGTDFTISTFIKGTTIGGARKVIATNQDDYITNGWGLAINQNGYEIGRLFLHTDSQTVISYNNYGAGQIAAGWHLVTGVWNPSNSSYKLYYDGVEVASASSTNTPTNTNTVLRLGGHVNSPDNRYAALDMSHITFYNRALSASEVQQNYNALKGRFGL